MILSNGLDIDIDPRHRRGVGLTGTEYGKRREWSDGESQRRCVEHMKQGWRDNVSVEGESGTHCRGDSAVVKESTLRRRNVRKHQGCRGCGKRYPPRVVAWDTARDATYYWKGQDDSLWRGLEAQWTAGS